MPSASVISLSVTNGMIRVFNSVLYQGASNFNGNILESSGAPASSSADTLADAPTAATTGNDTTSPSTNSTSMQSCRATPVARTGPRTWYVVKVAGNDQQHDGKAETHVWSTTIGPKRTVAAALANAVCGDTISVAAGAYPESVHVYGIRIITHGRVVLPSGRERLLEQ